MKRVEILIGSPRKLGNTFTLANHLNCLLNNANTESGISYLYNYDIKPCADCRACKSGEQKCIIKDDLREITERIEESDVIVFGTPIYWFGPTAKTKLLIDRLRPYFANKKLSNKKAAVILCAGSGAPDCDITLEMFRRIFEALEIKFIDYVMSAAYDIGDAAEDYLAIEKIKELSIKILNSKF